MININILTRTCNRPNYFKRNYESIKNQILPNDNVKIFHIVSYDEENTKLYLDEYNDIISVPVEKLFITKEHTFPYNHYLNDLHKHVKEGYILYLDDDDYLCSNNSISEIIPYLNEDSILIWRIERNKVILPHLSYFNKKQIVSSNYTSNCFTYHSKWLLNNNIKWTYTKNGDYKFLKLLKKYIININTLNKIICIVNNLIGGGRRKDLIINN